jgi:hypothetical protein
LLFSSRMSANTQNAARASNYLSNLQSADGVTKWLNS